MSTYTPEQAFAYSTYSAMRRPDQALGTVNARWYQARTILERRFCFQREWR